MRGPGAGHSHRLQIRSTRTADASEIEHDEGAHTGCRRAPRNAVYGRDGGNDVRRREQRPVTEIDAADDTLPADDAADVVERIEAGQRLEPDDDLRGPRLQDGPRLSHGGNPGVHHHRHSNGREIA